MAAPGALTRDNLVALAKQALGGRNSGLMTDTWYQDRVNAAYARICTFQGQVMAPGMRRPQMRVLRFFELYSDDDRTINTGLTDNFIIPTLTADRVVYVDDIYDLTNDKQITRKSIRYIKRRNPDETGTLIRSWSPGGSGSPGYYIHPLPSVAVSIRERTYTYPVAFTVGTDKPVIPAAWHAPIWVAAAAEGAMLIDWPEKAQEMEQNFISFIAQHRSPVEESGGAGGRRHFTVGGGSF